MNRPFLIGLTAGAAAIIVVGVVELALADRRNDFYEFCTTKAYGWPAPWKIDYCECEGAKTVYQTWSRIINLSVIGGCGFISSLLAGGIAYIYRAD